MNDAKYKTLFETLKTDILSGKYNVQNPFPSMRALIRRHGVSKTTVQRALDELVHQGLVSRKQGRGTFVSRKANSRKIGLILPGVAYSDFFPPMASELSRLAVKNGYSLLLGDATSTDHALRAKQVMTFAREFVSEKVAGVIFQPIELVADAERQNKAILDFFTAARIPVVLTCCDYLGFPLRSGYDVVGINNVSAGAMVANYLIEIGAKKIDFVMSPHRGASSKDRCRGVQEVVRQIGKKAYRCNVFSAHPTDLLAFRRYVKKGLPDAFVCCSDGDAAVFKKTIEAAGYRVPDDVKLVGFNDVRMASLLTPGLTTVRISREQIAQEAFRRLQARIEDPSLPAVECYLPVELVTRASTGIFRTERRRR